MKHVSSAVKIKCIKRLDSFIGTRIARVLSAPVVGPGSSVRSVLIVRPGGIGDALLLAPAIHAIRAHYPDAFITILAERRNAGVFALIPTIDRLLQYDCIADITQLFAGRYDLIIDTEQWHRLSAILVRLIPSSIKIGFATNERRKLFTHQVPYSHDVYEAQSFLNLLSPLGIMEVFDQTSPFLSLPSGAEIEKYRLLESFTSPYIAIFPGASVNERRWGVKKFNALALRLACSGISFIVIGGKEDRIAAEAIVAGTNGLNLAGMSTISGTAALIAGSRLLLSGDSGVLHIAAGLGIQTVSFFGAGIARKWAPLGRKHTVLHRNLTCSPCTLFGTTPPCPINVRCLEEISVDTVYTAIHLLLEP